MDSSTRSAVGCVPDALLVTVEAAMAWRRAGRNWLPAAMTEAAMAVE
jgi:hypothetical protein